MYAATLQLFHRIDEYVKEKLLLSIIFCEILGYFKKNNVFFSIILLQFLLAFLVGTRVKIRSNYKTVLFSFMCMVFILSVSLIDSYFVYFCALFSVIFLLYFKKQVIIQTLFFLNEKNSIHWYLVAGWQIYQPSY